MKYLIFIIIGVAVLAWCPWLSADEALSLIDAKVVERQKKTPNLCTMLIHKNSIRKVPFGYTERISYDCAKDDTEFGVLKSTNIVFVTFYKGVFGIPRKTFEKN